MLPILGGVIVASGLFTGCGGGSPAPLISSNSGEVTNHPDTAIGSQIFIGESHFGGEASTLKIQGIFWGRLVNVSDTTVVGQDVTHSDQMSNFLISGAIRDGHIFLPTVGNPIIFRLERNPVTDQFNLTIGAQAGTVGFEEALANLEANLTPIFDKSLDPNEVGPFSMVPRNSAVVIKFSDLLEPVFDNGGWHDLAGGDIVDFNNGQLNKDLVKIRTGYPPETPYEARVFVDPNHGNLADRDNDGVLEFYSTRVLVSSTVSALEAQSSNPPLGINSIGLPASVVTYDANMGVRIPTLVNAGLGQTQILRSAGGKVVSYTGNGSTDNQTGTNDVVRGLRSGGTLTSDPNNGFLLDEDAPSILADVSSTIVGTPVLTTAPDIYTLPTLSPECPVSIKQGDVVVQSGVSGLVLADAGPNTPVMVRVIAPVGGAFLPGDSRLQTRYDPQLDSVPACFLRFSPVPGILPVDSSTVQEVGPTAAIFVRFSEPMDPGTVKPFDSFAILRDDGSGEPDSTAFGYAIGRVVPEADLRTFRFDHPGVPFHHVAGNSENYFVTLSSGAAGPADLAGNPLVQGLPVVQFSIDPAAQEGRNAGFALRFASLGDDLFDDGLAELRIGQLLFDPVNERILPRPVNRFSVAADTNQPIVANMTAFQGGIQTPLSNLGSKLQTLWRYVDVGFSLSDETNYNLDVEGLSWAPSGGLIVADAYSEFSVTLSHSQWLPDEVLDMNGFPAFPGSGLKKVFANNLNDPIQDPGTVVHARSLGYVVNPANLYTASSGTPMVPMPVNEGKQLADYSFYTWRDTALTALGGASNGGAPVTLDPNQGTLSYTSGQIPTVGLPLLMEYRCYPADEALGLNAFDIALAVNSSARPNFRAFSTGGFDGNQLVTVDPDASLHDVAQGGFNPANNNATMETDNSLYYGEMALVTRVSRIHSIWFDTGLGATTYAQPIVEPEPADQAAGTSVTLAYRGAISVSGAGLVTDSTFIDPYGEVAQGMAGSVTFLPGISNQWVSDITQVNAARYFQVRLSFVSNAATNRTAELRTLAFAYFKG
ncbi:MAG: hypothetical protein ACI9F9_001550 [Candidatus Paceibacteria bacterium]